MDALKEIQTLGGFKCELCELSAPYMVDATTKLILNCAFGKKPMSMKDPFTSDKDKFVMVGSRCSLCSRAVCVDTDCGLFFYKSFCLLCVKENLKAFPLEIQEDMDKRKPQEKSCKNRIQSINLAGPRATVLWLGFLSLCLETIMLLLLKK